MKRKQGLFRKMRSGISHDIMQLKSFNNSLLGNSSVSCSYLAIAVSSISFIVAFVVFVVSGGYPTQIEAIKSYGVSAIEKTFSGGTTSIMFHPIVSSLVLAFLGIAAILMLIDFFISASIAKKTLMIINLALLLTSTVFLKIFADIIDGRIRLGESAEIFLMKTFESLHLDDFELVFRILFALIVLTAILLAVLIENKRLVSRIFYSALFSFAIMPLLLLFFENILALAAAVMFIAVLMLIVVFIGKVVLEGMRDSAKAATSSPDKSQKKTASKEEKQEVKVCEVDSNAIIYVDEGKGVGAPMTQCLFADTAFHNRVFLCTVKDYRDGKVIIKKGGKQYMMNI